MCLGDDFTDEKMSWSDNLDEPFTRTAEEEHQRVPPAQERSIGRTRNAWARRQGVPALLAYAGYANNQQSPASEVQVQPVPRHQQPTTDQTDVNLKNAIEPQKDVNLPELGTCKMADHGSLWSSQVLFELLSQTVVDALVKKAFTTWVQTQKVLEKLRSITGISSRSGANNNIDDDGVVTPQTSPASIGVNGPPKWSAREIFFGDLSKLRDMLMGTSGIAVVGLIALVSVNLREVARRYMHYCLFNMPLRIGMIPSTSTIVDSALAKLSVIPSLVPKRDGPDLVLCNSIN